MAPPRARVGILLALGVVLASSSGCASDTERYCGTLEERSTELSKLVEGAGSGKDVLDDLLGVLEDLRADAPDDLTDEWDTLVFAWRGLVEAMDEAGLAPADVQEGTVPKGVAEEDAEAVRAAAADLGSGRVRDAAGGIEQHASDVCKVDLGLEGDVRDAP